VNVEKGVVRGKGEQFIIGDKVMKADSAVVDSIMRQTLVDAVMQGCNIKASAQAIKDRLDNNNNNHTTRTPSHPFTP